MIDYLQVQRLSLKNNISPEIIEKDYLIELVLFYFSKDNFLYENIVFRGGTALKKIYFPIRNSKIRIYSWIPMY